MGIVIFVASVKERSFTTKLVENESEHTAESGRAARTASSLHSYRAGTVQVQHVQDIFCTHPPLERLR